MLPPPVGEGETRSKSPTSDTTDLSAAMLASTSQSAVSTPPTIVSDSITISSPNEKPTTPVKSIFDDDAEDENEMPAARIAEAAAKPKISVAELLAPKVKIERPARERRSLPVSYNISQTINAQSGFMYRSARRIRDANAAIPNNELTWRQTISAATPAKKRATKPLASTTTAAEDTTEVADGSAAHKEEENPAAAGTEVATKRRRGRPSKAKKPSEEPADATPKTSAKILRSKEKAEEEPVKMSRELMRLRDTEGFAEPKKANPDYISIWSKGKKIDPNAPPASTKASKSATASVSPKESSVDLDAAAVEEEPKKVEKSKPKYVGQGLYSGQEDPVDLALTPKERRAKARAARAAEKPRKYLPLPMWTGQQTLLDGRDFKLPFGVFNPLPPGSAKPEPYGKMTRNRFVGDAEAHWKKHIVDNSRCTCTEEDGCGEQCHNRLMLYECDEGNCSVSAANCKNRAFAELQERIKASKAHKFNIGVEVFKTVDRGFGVRANRSFEAGQIIVEYCGEIITQEESDRRMNNEYKNNECYYLMSFAQNMIIDATRGSIARFVNHCCEPNCKMDQWIVQGKTRMALFAERDIATGEELTYDYNFSNFNQSSVQTCLCGSPKCRGVVGRRGTKKPTPTLVEGVTNALKGAVQAGKRKLKEVLGGGKDEAAPADAKKRKVATPKGKAPVAAKSSAKPAAKSAAKPAANSPVKSAARKRVFAAATVSVKGKKAVVAAKATTVVAKPAPKIQLKLVQKPVQQRLKLLCKPAAPLGTKTASPVKKSSRKVKPTFRFINRTT